jgi:WD40 repeat protein
MFDFVVKAWSLIDDPNDTKAASVKRKLHTFTGHSRAVTGIVLHPETQTMFITSSLDGTVRFWSLDTLEQIYRYVLLTYTVHL